MDGRETKDKRVLVSGCFDLLHSGHVEFLRRAAGYGRLTVAVGSDRTVRRLKGRPALWPQGERLVMVRAVRHVAEAFVSSGSGTLDFAAEFWRMRPDVLVVNDDGDRTLKRQLCRTAGCRYVVLDRTPAEGIEARTSSGIRAAGRMPYRVEIAGGWLDQPWLSTMAPGPVICAAIQPDARFYPRSGLATSTRDKAIVMWRTGVPAGDREELARMLFCYDNPPGTEQFSGSQDAIGLALLAVKKINYAGRYWPESIETLEEPETLAWLERNVFLLPLGPRPQGCNVLDGCRPDEATARRLASCADGVWKRIVARDAAGLGTRLSESFTAQTAMFPAMVNDQVREGIASLGPAAGYAGYAVSGAGAGGYLIVVTDKPTGEMIRMEIATE